MSEEEQLQRSEQELEQEQQRKKEKALLSEKYRSRGIQQLSLAEYEALRSARRKKSGIKIPAPVKVIFATPVLFIFCYGLFFIPYTMFQVATGSPTQEKQSGGASLTKQTENNADTSKTQP